MNKDVIYIEPEDDITDIIAKIENSKEKIVALVPPKKAGILRSIVNIKLISRAGINAKKHVVLVTTDPSIVKLAIATKLPVTKDLQTPPTVPDAKVEIDETATEPVADGEEDLNDVDVDDSKNEEKEETEEPAEKEEKEEEPADDKKKKKSAKDKKPKKEFKNPVISWIYNHKKISIGIVIGVLLLILFIVWAVVIAPAVTVTIKLRTTKSNFSENVTFTDKITEEKAEEGKFYLETRKNETKIKREFEATGTKNVGEYATGEVIVHTYFRQKGIIAINAGSQFSISEFTYVSSEDYTLSWSGESQDVCLNAGKPDAITSGCLISTRIPVKAVAPGSKYNIAPSTTGWSTTASVGVYTDTAMSGGTDRTITIVTQADVDKVMSTITSASTEVSKEKLIDSIKEESEKDEDNTIFIISDSYKQTVGEPTVSPKVGEEVKDGVKPTFNVTVTDSIYIIDETKVREFITEKAKLANNYKIYQIGDEEKENGGLFIESFIKTDTGYTGKLKTTYISGPSVTENDIVEIVRGKGIGTAYHDLADVNGIEEETITPSYPWVSTVPNDPERITVNIKIPEDK